MTQFPCLPRALSGVKGEVAGTSRGQVRGHLEGNSRDIKAASAAGPAAGHLASNLNFSKGGEEAAETRVPLCSALPMCSCSVLSASLRPHGLQPARRLCPWDFPGKNTGAGRHFLPQGSSRPRDRTPSLSRLLHRRAGSWPAEPSGPAVHT